jgi:uncharacterized linocin/CFP29 family protein
MKYLNRMVTPLPPALWARIDDTAVQAMKKVLTGRRFLDLDGPYGVGLTSVEVGVDAFCREPAEGEASAVLSRAKSVPMIRKSFQLSIRQVEAYLTMGHPFEDSAIEEAAYAVAKREEEFIYYGQPDFDVEGLLTAKNRHQIQGGSWSQVEQALDDVLRAVTTLDDNGFHGPYALILSSSLYNNLFRRYEGTDMLQLDHLKRLCQRGVFKAPIEGAVVIDDRGGKLVLGQDLMAGYSANDGIHYHLFLSESIVPCLDEPRAICTLGQAPST